MATFAQLMVNRYHFFSTFERSPLKLLFYGLKSESFRLSKTVLAIWNTDLYPVHAFILRLHTCGNVLSESQHDYQGKLC